MLQKAYFGTLLSQQKSQYGVPLFGKTSCSTPYGYYSNPAFGIGSNPEGPPVIPSSPVGPGSPMRHKDFNMRLPGGVRNVAGYDGNGTWTTWRTHLLPLC